METHDLLQPPSQSKLMGEENIVLHIDPLLILEAKNKFQFRRCLRYIRFDPVFIGEKCPTGRILDNIFFEEVNVMLH